MLPVNTMLVIVIFIAGCVSFFFFLRFARRTLAIMRVRVISGENDDVTAAEQFITLVNRAEHLIVVYDDGNKMKGSLYDDKTVVEAVEKRLSENGNFNVKCFFNSSDQTRFVTSLQSMDRVDIRFRNNDESRPNDVHYKIIDDGAMGYLSRHAFGQAERNFTIVDCSRSKPAKQLMLGKYLMDFKRKFDAHSSIASA